MTYKNKDSSRLNLCLHTTTLQTLGLRTFKEMY